MFARPSLNRFIHCPVKIEARALAKNSMTQLTYRFFARWPEEESEIESAHLYE